MEPGWFADMLISLEARGAGGRKSTLCLVEERKEEGTGEKNHPLLFTYT